MRKTKQAKMNRTTLLQRMRNDGYVVGSQVLRYAIETGWVSIPPRDALNRSVYSEKHHQEFLAYLKMRRNPNALAMKRALASKVLQLCNAS